MRQIGQNWWSERADEVLEDPIYRDRIEWEFAEGVLNGNRVATSSRTESAVSELLEISERFGWDNQDKAGWSRVNFELLGTSKGGRIPRRLPTTPSDRQDDKDLDEAGRGHGFGVKRGLALPEDEKRRRERRERLRLKRSDRYNYGEPYRTEVTGEVVKKRDRDANARARGRRGGGGEEEETSSDSGSDSSSWTVGEDVYNPFPGRDGLLKKVLHLNRRRSL